MQVTNQTDCSLQSLDEMKNSLEIQSQINLYQFLITDSIVLLATLSLAVTLFRQKEKNLFEIRIVGCMGISFLIWVFDHIDYMYIGKKDESSLSDIPHCFLFALAACCYQFAYWTYAS